MARKPNYRFERSERERLKAAKKAARDDAKQQRAALKQAEQTDDKPAGEATERKE
jgi:hypothetical protein